MFGLDKLFGFGSNPEPEIALPTSYDIQCAWCNAEAGIEQGSGSHGVCEQHSLQMRVDSKMRKFDAVPSYVEQQAAAFAQEASSTLSAAGYSFCAECGGYYLPHEH